MRSNAAEFSQSVYVLCTIDIYNKIVAIKIIMY